MRRGAGSVRMGGDESHQDCQTPKYGQCRDGHVLQRFGQFRLGRGQSGAVDLAARRRSDPSVTYQSY
jgi:hypothetical protein